MREKSISKPNCTILYKLIIYGTDGALELVSWSLSERFFGLRAGWGFMGSLTRWS